MQWLTVKQAADIMQVSPGTIRAMIDSGRMQATLVGAGVKRKTYRIPSDCLQFVSAAEPTKSSEPQFRSSAKIHPSIAKAMGI